MTEMSTIDDATEEELAQLIRAVDERDLSTGTTAWLIRFARGRYRYRGRIEQLVYWLERRYERRLCRMNTVNDATAEDLARLIELTDNYDISDYALRWLIGFAEARYPYPGSFAQLTSWAEMSSLRKLTRPAGAPAR